MADSSADLPSDKLSIPDTLALRHSPRNAANRSAAAGAIGAAWADRFESIGGLTSTDRILDIGCGPGRMAIAIGEKFGWSNQYAGFDIFEEDIDFARASITSQHPNFTFQHLDIRNEYYRPLGSLYAASVRFPVASASVDFAFATSVFTHFFEADTLNYLRETFRALKPGGRFLATFFLLSDTYQTDDKPKKARFNIQHPMGENTFIAYPEEPGKVVGYPATFVQRAYAEIGFTDVEVRLGSWNCADGAISGQDVILARKSS